MPDEIMIIDDWVDALSEEAHMRVLTRALSALRVPYVLKTDGFGEPEFDRDDLPDHDLVNAAMNIEYKKMHAAELLDSLVSKKAIVPDHVNEAGEIIYVATDQ